MNPPGQNAPPACGSGCSFTSHNHLIFPVLPFIKILPPLLSRDSHAQSACSRGQAGAARREKRPCSPQHARSTSSVFPSSASCWPWLRSLPGPLCNAHCIAPAARNRHVPQILQAMVHLDCTVRNFAVAVTELFDLVAAACAATALRRAAKKSMLDCVAGTSWSKTG